eukprot:gb/GFBE01066804.1/.p1 GENE.gb/GFBE01066804.1/~~gb/GFBE01066804.1/.p1  ORF type:complete len:343 (+),score=62.36 gb/GFBE01066804.1/:1-1029(+)
MAVGLAALILTAQNFCVLGSGVVPSSTCQDPDCSGQDEVALLQADMKGYPYYSGHGYRTPSSPSPSSPAPSPITQILPSPPCDACDGVKKEVQDLKQEVKDLRSQLAEQLKQLQAAYQKSQQEIQGLQAWQAGRPPPSACSAHGSCAYGVDIRWQIDSASPQWDKMTLVNEWYQLLLDAGLDAQCLQPMQVHPVTFGSWGVIFSHLTFNSTTARAKAIAEILLHKGSNKDIKIFTTASKTCPDACADGANYMEMNVTYADKPECKKLLWDATGFGGSGFAVEGIPATGGRAGFSWMIPHGQNGAYAISLVTDLEKASQRVTATQSCAFKTDFALNQKQCPYP